MAEKVIARTSGRDRVTPGEFVSCRIDRVRAPEMLEILERGGLMAMLEERVRGAAS